MVYDSGNGGQTKITLTGHGLRLNDLVVFTNISQCSPTPDSNNNYAAEWMDLNWRVVTVNSIIDANNFTVSWNSNGYTAYNAGTDQGQLAALCNIKGQIEAGKTQIFKLAAPSVYFEWQSGSRNQLEMYVEWFGAKGDGSDDLEAFNYTRTAAVISNSQCGRAVIYLTGKYYLSDTWSFNNIGLSYVGISIRGVHRRSSGIISGADGFPALEMCGVQNMYLSRFCITGNSEYNPGVTTGVPSVAILLSRSNIQTAEGGCNFDDMEFYGYYQYGVIL